jgi:hypothetical protein
MINTDESLIFNHLSLLGLKLDKKQLESFREYIFSKKMLKKYQLQSLVGLFHVDISKMQFRLIERTKHDENVALLTEMEIEFELILIFKMAKEIGFDIFFENKFSN